MSNQLYLLFGTVTARTDKSATFSTGHTVHFEFDYIGRKFEIGTDHFVTVYQKGGGPYRRTLRHYVKEVSTIEDTSDISRATSELADAVAAAKGAYDTFSGAERAVVMGYLQTTLMGGVSVLSAVQAGYEVYNLLTGGPLNPLNLVTSAAMAGVTGFMATLSWENLTQRQQDLYKKIEKVKQTYDVLSRLMRKYMPETSRNAVALNPSTKRIMDSLKTWFHIDSVSFWEDLQAQELVTANA